MFFRFRVFADVCLWIKLISYNKILSIVPYYLSLLTRNIEKDKYHHRIYFVNNYSFTGR
ncbi:Uncharacterized protein dnm_038830 [Desulfonema magnum]|uniref:Uncharacterized protein n=1 Tax=Desulfonema magnum TaxID=45655 RepID=A0A975BLV5_9BACT|nr:Uncharacterized protein dnm_038830 [Desulfonema magnum]